MTASERTRIQLEELEAMLDAIPDIVCFKDGEGRWIKANKADIELFQLEGVDYRGKRDSDLAEFSPFFRDAFLTCEKTDEAAWQRGKVSRGLEWIPRPDGSVSIFDVYKIPLFNDDGSRRGLVVFGRDVTDLMESREELKRKNRLFAEAERLADLGHWQWWIDEDRLEFSEGIFHIFREEGVEQVFPSNLPEFLEKIHPEDRAGFERALYDFLSSNKERFEYEHRLVLITGRVKLVRHVAMVERDGEGKPVVMRGVTQDISELKEMSYKITLSEMVFQHCIEGIVVTDAEGTILDVNPAFTDITGYSREEAIGQNPRILKSDRHDEAFYADMWRQILETGGWSGEIWNRRKSGEVYPEILTIRAVKDIDGKVKNYLSIFYDLTEEKKREEESLFYRYYDPLTGLMNRHHMMERLRSLAKRVKQEGGTIGLLLLDLDRFREINEALSYETGDILLKKVASQLLQIGSPDEVARVGEDCFAFILESGQGRLDFDPVRVADTVANLISDLGIDGHRIKLTGCIGISLLPNDTDDPDELFRYADIALRRAKSIGPGSFRFFDKEMFYQARKRLELAGEIRGALGKGEFVPYYQPKVSLRTGRIEGFEALVRWQHGDELLNPGAFIPLAEETGLIVGITRELLGQVVRDLSLFLAKEPSLSVAVNFSQHCFRQKGFVERVGEAMEMGGISPSALQVEITETMLMEDEEHVTRILDQFHARGTTIALDDFGTGYSSLYYLKNLPIDLVKMDRSFVMDLEDSDTSKKLVRAILSMAEALNIETCAEGVETRGQLEFLARHGCSLAQGYLFSHPVPFDEAVALLDESMWDRCGFCFFDEEQGDRE